VDDSFALWTFFPDDMVARHLAIHVCVDSQTQV
jgi:hypothetical protein